MRMGAKPHVAAHLAYNVRGDGVLSRCTTNLLSPSPRFTPPLLLSVSLSPKSAAAFSLSALRLQV